MHTSNSSIYRAPYEVFVPAIMLIPTREDASLCAWTVLSTSKYNRDSGCN